MFIIKDYTYLFEIFKAIKNNKPFPVNEIHLVGGRLSGKTVSVQAVLGIISSLPTKIAIYALRNSVKDSSELYTDIVEAFEFFDFKFSATGTKQIIRLGSNKIRVIGLNTMAKGNVAKKSGLAKTNAKYIIRYWEEAYEFSETDKMSIREAVRSISDEETYILDIFVCNPWSKGHPYISYLGDLQPWNLAKLKSCGSQFGIREVKVGEGDEQRTKKIAIHYTNWRVAKDVLAADQIKNILNTWKIDRNRALTTDYGLPGYENGAIYTHLLHHIGGSIWKEQDQILCGGDYGWSNRASGGKTAFYFTGFSYGSGMDVYGEYYHDNSKIQKNTNLLATEVVQFYIVMMEWYCRKIHAFKPFYIKVRVDNMAQGLITLLNNEAQKRGVSSWLYFMKSRKYPIQDRIVLELSALGSQNIRVSAKETPYPVVHLLKEFEMARYEELDTQKRVKEADHCLNALEYGFEPIQYRWLKYLGNTEKLKHVSKENVWL